MIALLTKKSAPTATSNPIQWAKQNWSPWIGAMFVIYMANPDWTEQTEEYWWSITKPDGTPMGAYVRLKAMAK